MGFILKKYHDFAKSYGGIQVLVKIAVKTCITSNNVTTLPDSKENIDKLKNVIRELMPEGPLPEET